MKITYHKLIEPYANAFATTVAGILGWRLFKKDEFAKFLTSLGNKDRIALVSEIGKKKNKNATFSFRKSVCPLVSGNYDHHRLLGIPALFLLGHCYSILEEHKFVPDHSSSILEFYRHIRNGCFHGNKFHFYDWEPTHKAEWQGLVITKGLQNKRIFRNSLKEKRYFLNWGDSLLLLHDVSKRIA